MSSPAQGDPDRDRGVPPGDPERGAPPRDRERGAPPRVALVVATALGAGLVPLAPGTVGSLVGVAVFLALAALPGWLFVLTGLALCALGVWAAALAEQWYGRVDDGRIVIDEVAGQVIALSPLLVLRPVSLFSGLVTGFVAFRVLDIWKPGPVRWAERGIGGGAGVMADDIVAGALAALMVGALGLLGVFGATPRHGVPL